MTCYNDVSFGGSSELVESGNITNDSCAAQCQKDPTCLSFETAPLHICALSGSFANNNGLLRPSQGVVYCYKGTHMTIIFSSKKDRFTKM